MIQEARSLERPTSTTRDDIAVMNKLANALERLLNAQSAVTPQGYLQGT